MESFTGSVTVRRSRLGETDKYEEERNSGGFTRDEAVLRLPALEESILLNPCRKSCQSASGPPEPNRPASFHLRRKPTKDTAGNSFRKRRREKMKEKHRKWVQTQLLLKGLAWAAPWRRKSYQNGAARSHLKGEQRKKGIQDFPRRVAFLFASFPTGFGRSFTCMWRRAAARSGWCLVSDVASCSSMKPRGEQLGSMAGKKKK